MLTLIVVVILRGALCVFTPDQPPSQLWPALRIGGALKLPPFVGDLAVGLFHLEVLYPFGGFLRLFGFAPIFVGATHRWPLVDITGPQDVQQILQMERD